MADITIADIQAAVQRREISPNDAQYLMQALQLQQDATSPIAQVPPPQEQAPPVQGESVQMPPAPDQSVQEAPPPEQPPMDAILAMLLDPNTPPEVKRRLLMQLQSAGAPANALPQEVLSPPQDVLQGLPQAQAGGGF